MPKKVDLVGQVFGKLTVVAMAPGAFARPDGSLLTGAEAICACGTRKTFKPCNLRSGSTVSCGCVAVAVSKARAARQRKESIVLANPAEYQAWEAMHWRCKRDPHYVGRVTVCAEWSGRNNGSFARFLTHIGRRPGPGYSVDRFPNGAGNYEPGNVRWATWGEQARNKSSAVILTLNGESMNLIDWCARLGLKITTARGRLKRGWPVERALSAA